MTADLTQSLATVQELERFVYRLHGKLAKFTLKDGEDLVARARKTRVRIPKFLEGAKIRYQKPGAHGRRPPRRRQPVILFRQKPDHPDERVTFCFWIEWGGKIYVICLQCWWFGCRIVITPF